MFLNDEYQMQSNKVPGKLYVSSRFKSMSDDPTDLRYGSLIIENSENLDYVKVKNEIQLRLTSGGRQEIKAVFHEDSRNIGTLTIQKFTVETGSPHKTYFTFRSDELNELIKFLYGIGIVDISTEGKFTVPNHELKQMILNENQARKLFRQNKELITSLVESDVKDKDVIALGYRRNELEFFQRLLTDPDYSILMKKKYGNSLERVWQVFFERNPWVFGYGLTLLYLSPLDGKKLEQVTSGYSVHGHGKRIDALLKSKGIISTLCFAEIKTPETALIGRESRPGCWSPSRDLVDAITQLQGTISRAIQDIYGKFKITDEEGYPTNEDVFLYKPKAFLIIGELSEFKNDQGIHEAQYRSFELFRKNINDIEILTFDELYERVKYIVNHSDRE